MSCQSQLKIMNGQWITICKIKKKKEKTIYWQNMWNCENKKSKYAIKSISIKASYNLN